MTLGHDQSTSNSSEAFAALTAAPNILTALHTGKMAEPEFLRKAISSVPLILHHAKETGADHRLSIQIASSLEREIISIALRQASDRSQGRTIKLPVGVELGTQRPDDIRVSVALADGKTVGCYISLQHLYRSQAVINSIKSTLLGNESPSYNPNFPVRRPEQADTQRPRHVMPRRDQPNGRIIAQAALPATPTPEVVEPAPSPHEQELARSLKILQDTVSPSTPAAAAYLILTRAFLHDELPQQVQTIRLEQRDNRPFVRVNVQKADWTTKGNLIALSDVVTAAQQILKPQQISITPRKLQAMVQQIAEEFANGNTRR